MRYFSLSPFFNLSFFGQNSTSWVLLNIASLYWRVQGDTAEAIKCLRQALSFSPPNARVCVALSKLKPKRVDEDFTVVLTLKISIIDNNISQEN